MRERVARWRLLRVLSEYSLSLTVTQNEPIVDPRGEPAVLCFGYQLGTGVPPWGPPPHAGPAVHSVYGSTALHYAALYGNRRIVRSLVDANADVKARDREGCAVCACGESAVECAAPSHRRRRPCRSTPLHIAVFNCHSSSVAELLLRGADGAVQNKFGYRCAAPHSRNRKPQQPRARRTPKRWAEQFGKLAAYEAGEREVHSARRLTAPPPSLLPRAPSLPTLLVPSVRAVGARRSSGEGGDSPCRLAL
jgi:hypothetical protein